jgi:glycosyltransferase involved in cell wall biosynthesis
MRPLVSIITITYQAESVLKRTLESVLAQEFRDYEYLLIDGCSKDGTLAMIREYETVFQQKDINFRWISEPDKGIYDAMNKGLRLAQGDYVWFMNAGDKIAFPDTLYSIWKTIPEYSPNTETSLLPDFIYGETLIANDEGTIMGERRLKAPETLTWKSFRMGMLVCHQAMLVKRALAPEYNLRYHYSADFDWSIRCLRKAGSIHNTKLVLSCFLDGGVSKKKMKASLKERFEIMAENYGWISTVFRHAWFICRATWFKLFHGWI